jgi:hypothetical protein
MAGIDLLSGHVHALVRARHRSREFIEFLKLLDAAYPAETAIEIILDNHSAHVSRETTAWLAAQPTGRFTFTFTPTHGSWLNLIEGFFSKGRTPGAGLLCLAAGSRRGDSLECRPTRAVAGGSGMVARAAKASDRAIIGKVMGKFCCGVAVADRITTCCQTPLHSRQIQLSCTLGWRR